MSLLFPKDHEIRTLLHTSCKAGGTQTERTEEFTPDLHTAKVKGRTNHDIGSESLDVFALELTQTPHVSNNCVLKASTARSPAFLHEKRF